MKRTRKAFRKMRPSISRNKASVADQGKYHGFIAATVYLLTHMRECVLMITRVLTMMFTLCYFFLLPITSAYHSYYYKALIASGVTSIVRMNQRLPRLEFSKAYLAKLLKEDSFHYVLYSLTFVFSHPVTLVLLPVYLYAFLHSTSFASKVLKEFGMGQSWFVSKFFPMVDKNSKRMLHLISYAEIFLMPFSTLLLFIGKASLLTPVLYYQFVSLHYRSLRNPYIRTLFFELRLCAHFLANQPVIPERIRHLYLKAIDSI